VAAGQRLLRARKERPYLCTSARLTQSSTASIPRSSMISAPLARLQPILLGGNHRPSSAKPSMKAGSRWSRPGPHQLCVGPNMGRVRLVGARMPGDPVHRVGWGGGGSVRQNVADLKRGRHQPTGALAGSSASPDGLWPQQL